MSGLSRRTGRALDSSSDAHLEQSIGDILTTPLNARPMRRSYGAELADLVDQPNNPLTRIRAFASTAMALQTWEPRAQLKRVQLVLAAAGNAAALRVSMVRRDRPGRPTVELTIPLRSA